MQFLSYSSLPIALFAGAITLFYGQLLSESLDLIRALLNTLGTFIIYNLVQIIPIYTSPYQSYRKDWFKRNLKFIFPLLALASITIIGLLKYINLYDFLNYAHLALLCMFYEGPFKYNFRKIPYIKSILIAYVWTMAVVAPHYYDNFITPSLWYLVEFYLYLLALCLAFDMRDRRVDIVEGVKTFVNRVPYVYAKILIMGVFVLSSIILTLLMGFKWSLPLYVFIHLGILYAVNPKRHDYFYLWAVDGLIFIKSLMLWNFK
jgi:hypothetical protein